MMKKDLTPFLTESIKKKKSKDKSVRINSPNPEIKSMNGNDIKNMTKAHFTQYSIND